MLFQLRRNAVKTCIETPLNEFFKFRIVKIIVHFIKIIIDHVQNQTFKVISSACYCEIMCKKKLRKSNNFKLSKIMEPKNSEFFREIFVDSMFVILFRCDHRKSTHRNMPILFINWMSLNSKITNLKNEKLYKFIFKIMILNLKIKSRTCYITLGVLKTTISYV